MNVYFDYQIFYLQRYGGISRYFFELANELNKITSCSSQIVAPFHSNNYLQSAGHQKFILTFQPALRKLFYNRLYNRQIWINEAMTRLVCSGKKNAVIHETYYTNRFSVRAPKVITIHDMIHEIYPSGQEGDKVLISQKKKAIQEADAVIAVSENTRKDLLTFYPQAKDKTFVVHHGVRHVDPEMIKGYVHSKPFFLHVGNRGWYKNFERLLRVYAEQKSIHENADLICFGGGNFTESELELIKKHNLQTKVHLVSGDDNVLNALYKSALALVYISSYEGFGMPVLEAMNLSCPVICSNNSSIPEVAGDAAWMIDGENEQNLLDALKSVISDSRLRTNLAGLGKDRANLFSWSKCADQTHSIYKKLV